MKPSSIVLCGGKERRFGRSKARAIVGGLPTIERVLSVLEVISGEIILVTAPEKADVPGKDRVRVVFDAYPGKGPLGGIYTGLLEIKSEIAIVVACDMPFLNPKLLIHMCEIAEGYDAVVPRLGGEMMEPLHAVYSKNCVTVMKAGLESGVLAIAPILPGINVRYMSKEEYLPLDPRMLSFFNINYPEDFDRANRIASQLESGPLTAQESAG
jgi:molybdenum cofactor guanylyltransferase